MQSTWRVCVWTIALVAGGIPVLALAQAGDAWVVRYDSPLATNDGDWLTSMVVDAGGNVYVAGPTRGQGTDEDVTTIKYSPHGDTLWLRRYDSPGHGGDIPELLTLDGSGNVYLTGRSWNHKETDCLTLKYSSQGDLLWASRYDGPDKGDDEGRAVAVDKAGNVFVGGISQGEKNTDMIVLKYSPAGDTLWTRRFASADGKAEVLFAMGVDADGNVVATGFGPGPEDSSKDDYVTLKYGPNGDRLWVRYYDGPAHSEDMARALAVVGDGSVVVTGSSTGIGTNTDCTTIKYAPNGDTLWVRRYDGPSRFNDDGVAVCVDAAGNVLVAASSGDSLSSWDYATIKYGSGGEMAWSKRFDVRGGDQVPSALTFDAAGNVYVTGTSGPHQVSYDKPAGKDIATVKYTAAGEYEGLRTYDGPAKGDDTAAAVAVDAAGNLYVAGTSVGIRTGTDFVLIKNQPVDPPVIQAQRSVAKASHRHRHATPRKRKTKTR